jgi:hypothetical protein
VAVAVVLVEVLTQAVPVVVEAEQTVDLVVQVEQTLVVEAEVVGIILQAHTAVLVVQAS